MSTNTIFYLKGGGRFGNQLLNWCHLLAYAVEYKQQNIRIVSMGLIKFNQLLTTQDNAYFYKTTANEFGFPLFIRIILWLQSVGLDNLAKNYGNLMMFTVFGNPFSKRLKYRNDDYLDYELNSHSFFSKLYKTNKVALWGWGFRCWDLLDKHEDEVRNMMKTDSVHHAAAKTFVEKHMATDELAIGVLIRHTDYRDDWQQGRFYFESAMYENWICQLHDSYNSKGIKVKFIVCSDEKQQLDLLKLRNIPFEFGPGHATGDQHYIQNFFVLSLCHCIMTPPSTFSGMAAFLGKAEVVLLKDKHQTITVDSIMRKHIFEVNKDEMGKVAIN